MAFFSFGLILLYAYIASAVWVHFRGQARLGFFRQLTDHSTLMAPVNCLIYLFSKTPSQPYLARDDFPELDLLKQNWRLIREEADRLYQAGHVKRSNKLDDIGFNSFFKTGWKRFYLKWYHGNQPSAEQLCPNTIALLNRCPHVKAAMFALLPPGGRLVRHRDPYAGSLRYHLGLDTPNSSDCFIDVDGQRYAWQDGEDVLFDETYLHFAQNKTDQNRLILFCDIERPMNNPLARLFNRLFGRVVMAAAATANTDIDHTGVLNRLFAPLYQIRLLGKRLKKKSKAIYYPVKYLLFGGLVYLIFF